MHLANEIFDHLLSRLKISDNTIFQRTNRLYFRRSATQHQLRLVTKRKRLHTPTIIFARHNRWLIQHNAAAFHIHQCIGGTEVNGHIR